MKKLQKSSRGVLTDGVISKLIVPGGAFRIWFCAAQPLFETASRSIGVAAAANRARVVVTI